MMKFNRSFRWIDVNLVCSRDSDVSDRGKLVVFLVKLLSTKMILSEIPFFLID